MDMPIDANTRFAIGQPVSRKEDPVLLRGEGRYSDDLSLPGQVYAVIVRSRYAHGDLNRIDSAEALAMPGVLAVITAADLDAAGIGPMQAGGRQAPRRDADAEAAPDRAGPGPRPLRWRPGGDGGCRDAGGSEGRGRGGHARHHPPARRDGGACGRRPWGSATLR